MSKRRKTKNTKAPKRRKPAASAAQDPDKLRRRVTRVRPLPFSGELPVDIAVFDDAALRKLGDQADSELAAEVRLVREALHLVSDGRDDDANLRLSSISRRSPLSQWRLFIRGLVDWYADRFDEAQESWKRLDPERRPSRMARAMMASLHTDLDLLVSAGPSSTLGQAAEAKGWDHWICSAARLVRRMRVDRPALAEAVRETSRREKSPARVANQIRIGRERLDWVIEFGKEYQPFEPQLVAALQATAHDLAMKQPFADLHQLAMRSLPGPSHDPDNLLSRSLYNRQFEGGEQEADAQLKEYLTSSLSNNERIASQLRAAIESEIYLEQAREKDKGDDDGSLYARFMRQPIDAKRVSKLYQQALSAYPAHTEAHREYVEWIRQHAENDWNRKAEREPFEKLLPPAMQAWSEGVPDEIEPRLWLVDHYLENEKLEQAQPHVQWLAGSRHADPRVRATPWKWEVLEAMRLCRRKVWLKEVPSKLDAAAKLWPSWLSQDWLAYLRAALLLRQNQREEFEAARVTIRNQCAVAGQPVCDLTDAAMMLGAAQLMRVPAADLKPLRQPIDEAVKTVEKLAISELVQTASFFWDLQRINLFYPAYRMHGGKFATELHKRLKVVRTTDLSDPIGKPEFVETVYWLASRNMFTDGYQFKFSKPLDKFVSELTRAAALVQNYLIARVNIRGQLRNHAREIKILRDAAAIEMDSYYRHWFESLADRADAIVTADRSERSGFGSSGFNPFEAFDFGDEGDDEDEQNDEQCNCPECQRQRAYQAAGLPFDPDDFEDGDDEDSSDLFFNSNVFVNNDFEADPNVEPPKPPTQRVDAAPSDPNFKRTRPKDPLGKKRRKKKQ